MESAVKPVHHEIRADQEDRRLQPERQPRERPVPVIVEFDQSLGGGDAEQERGAHDQEPDAQIAGEQRDDEPIAKIGHQLALAPPGLARIAGPEEGQNREDGSERDRYRQDLDESDADAVDDGEEFLEHDAETNDARATWHARVSSVAVKMP